MKMHLFSPKYSLNHRSFLHDLEKSINAILEADCHEIKISIVEYDLTDYNICRLTCNNWLWKHMTCQGQYTDGIIVAALYSFPLLSLVSIRMK